MKKLLFLLFITLSFTAIAQEGKDPKPPKDSTNNPSLIETVSTQEENFLKKAINSFTNCCRSGKICRFTS